MAIISELNVYPVKSLQGISLEHATLTGRGIEFDRNWMIADDSGMFVTQRQLPKMATIRVILDEHFLMLEHNSTEPLQIALSRKTSEKVTTTVWDDICQGYDEGAAASDWLNQVLGKYKDSELRLIRIAEDFIRPVDPNYMNGQSAATAFADGYPFLITSEKSLSELNNQLTINRAAKVPMSRFRPNIVLSEIEAFEENRLERLTSEGNTYELVIRKPCKRCKVTTVDQETGLIDNPKEPLKTLAMMNHYPELSGAFFGQNATLSLGEGSSMRVGDRLNIHVKG